MRYSPEELIAFVQVSNLGSFSAAARKLNKSQSTISIAIANLETDIGTRLFDRHARETVLTDAGRMVLKHVNDILGASDRLDELSIQLAQQVESRVSIVFSDLYQVDVTPCFMRFAERFPHTDIECSVAEDTDAVRRVQAGEARLGIIPARPDYPPEIAARRMPGRSPMGLFVGTAHPLARTPGVTLEALRSVRELLLKPLASHTPERRGAVWSAQNYLVLLEMVRSGFGWAELPCELVQRYGQDALVQLDVTGWPRHQDMDLIWSRDTLPGPAGFWLIDTLIQAGWTDRDAHA